MKTNIFLPLSALALFIFSCDRSNSSNLKAGKDMSIEPPVVQNKVSNVQLPKLRNTDSTDGISLQGSVPGQNPDWDKKIIKTAVLKLEVKDFKVCSDLIHRSAKQYGGYIAGEDQSQSADKKESTISIKVPVEQFEALMNQLPSDSDKIIEKKITTEDVTGEVVDTKSRLQAKEQMRLKYLEFLKQAKNMEDVLKVQGEINNIQEEMESASGRINYLSHQSVYSTINLTFYQPLAGYNPSDDSPGFLTRTLKAFKTGVDFIAEIFIGLISVWPLCLAAFIIWVLWKRHSWKVVAAKQKL
jgi:hypothetical protein